MEILQPTVELTPEEIDAKQRKIDEASFQMYENTKEQTRKIMRAKKTKDGNRMYTDEQIEAQIKLIERSQADVIDDYVARGGNYSDLEALVGGKKKGRKKKVTDDEFEPVETIARPNKRREIDDREIEEDVERDINMLPKKSQGGNRETYDYIPLPSKGECYKSKIAKMPVAELTAYDENMIVAPNLYRDNLIIDTILEEKILNDTIDPADLLEGDRDAIILYLRANGYGVEYPITVTDEETGKQFDTIIDLSKIQYKPFKLKGDENGWFDYTLPVGGNEIKFKFLTHRDNLKLRKREELENVAVKKERLADFAERLNEFVENDEILDKVQKVKVNEGIRAIEDWANEIDEEEGVRYTHLVTNKLEASIMSVDGITDRKIIKKFVRSMSVKDSSSLRKYILENEPGVDYNFKIERPKELGGGSIDTFLQFDQYIFLNIAE